MSIKTATLQPGYSQPQPAWVKRWFNPEALTAYLFLLPSLVGFSVFYAVPAIRGLTVSFTNWNMLQEPQFVGLQNYVRLIQDPDFWNHHRPVCQYRFDGATRQPHCQHCKYNQAQGTGQCVGKRRLPDKIRRQGRHQHRYLSGYRFSRHREKHQRQG